jgi:hypothetical protein
MHLVARTWGLLMRPKPKPGFLLVARREWRWLLHEGETARHPRLLEQYSYRARAAARFSDAAGGLNDKRRDHFTVVLAAVTAGPTELLRLHRTGIDS